MATLTFAQALSYAQGAGFQGQSAYVITAIAMAESGLNTQAQNCNNPGGSCDRGIVQINNYWHKEVSDQCAYDPACAFKAAYTISSSGTNFNPWTTFTSGAYKQYIQPGAGADPTALADLQQSTSTNAGNCAPWDIGCILQSFGDTLPRIGKGILGGLLMLVALWFGLRAIMSTEVGSAVGKAAKDVKKFF